MENIKRPLVENIIEVLENIKTFNKELPNSEHLIRKLSSFKQWYYSNELDMFGPSMFLGYKKNSATEYKKGTAYGDRYMDGWDTEAVIRQWSIEAKGADFMELEEKLSVMLSEYDKKLKSNARIHLLSR
jgi:5-methylcytosine-specific restriction enzyme A